ncbi:MAG: 3-deoxy-manno-octulosonate cytidylyltransferase [Chloroflexi bacterium]|nr:3-deoxy-manno-octulosonate cytidylyltransferase [Chloroflexota bacterium]
MIVLKSHTPKTVAIIQARMGSSRLPGKVLKKIAGRPMLGWVVERAGRAQTVDQVVVATTTAPSDQAVADFCTSAGYAHTRGDVHDVLDRYYTAAQEFEADAIVRLTADCPLIDPDVIDKTVHAFQTGNPPPDFAANRLPPPWGRTYPIGLDVEVCSFSALEQAWQEAELPHQREHVMPYLYENEERFNILMVDYEQDLGHLRWTVDTPADLDLIREVAVHLGGRDDFSWLDVLALLERKPELNEINAHVDHKNVHDIDERRK